MGELGIRPASPIDARVAAELWTEAYVTEGEGGRIEPYAERDLTAMLDRGAVAVAELDGTVVGVVTLFPPGAPARAVARGEEAELARLAVAGRARRHGVGRALVLHCAELARAEGWRAIALWSRPYQNAAHRLYEALGYRRKPARDTTDETGHGRLVFVLDLDRHGRMNSVQTPSDPPSRRPEIDLRYAETAAELDAVEPLWNALQTHHAEISPELCGTAPSREAGDAWRIRRGKYERWLQDPDTFFVIAEADDEPVGYAFVTVGPGYASWQTSERLAELETLSVLPERRGDGVGAALIEATWQRLAKLGVEDMQITTTTTNIDSHRFYEREGFRQSFVVYYGKSPAGRSE